MKSPKLILELAVLPKRDYYTLTGLAKTSSNTDTVKKFGNSSNEVMEGVTGGLSKTVLVKQAVLH